MIKNSIKDLFHWGKCFKVCVSEHVSSATEVNQSPAAQQIHMIAFGDFQLRVCFTHSFFSPRWPESRARLFVLSLSLARAVCALESAPQAESLELWGLWSAGRLSPPSGRGSGQPKSSLWRLLAFVSAAVCKAAILYTGYWLDCYSTDLGNLLLN